MRQFQMIQSFQQDKMGVEIARDNKKRVKYKDYNKILAVDDKYKLQQQQVSKVKSQLSQQLDYLIEKKQKQKQMKKRLQMMQQEFQLKRRQKLQQLQGKINRSSKSKSHKIKQKLQKNRRNLQYVSRINLKHHNDYKQIITKGLQRRKQYYSQYNTNHKTLVPDYYSRQNQIIHHHNNSSNLLFNDNELMSSRTSNNIKTPREDVGLAIRSIEEKMEKAKRNHEMYKRQIVNKLNQKERSYQQMKERIVSHAIIEQQKVLRQAYGKSEGIVEAGEKVREMTERQLNDRRRCFQQKIRKIHQNIKYLQQSKQQKFASLENKFNKIYEPAMGRNRGSLTQTNRQRVMLNHLKLQQEKKIKADGILKKHAEITTKNKIYKEKKDQILQTISKSHSKLE